MKANWQQAGYYRRALVNETGRIIGAIREMGLTGSTWVTEGSETYEYVSREAAEEAVEKRVLRS